MDKAKPPATASKNISGIVLSLLFVFAFAFLLSSGIFSKGCAYALNYCDLKMKPLLNYHLNTLAIPARHYFLMPDGGYTFSFQNEPLSFFTLVTITTNALANSLFQPIFLCVFTPQVILNYLLFPFFLYGVVKYFKKVPILIVVFFVLSAYVAIYGSVVEALVRHRISCEMIYYLIGSAGFTSWITRSS